MTENQQFVSQGLYGGAISVKLPRNFFDTSQIREIPDHQEVYLDRDGFSSITFDILERVVEESTDDGALLYHLFDVVDANERVCITTPTSVEMSHHLVPAWSIIAGTRPVENRDGGKDLTVLMMLLVRLEMHDTDILVTVNLPYRGKQFQGEIIDLNQSVETGMADDMYELGTSILSTITQSFEVQDWGLFG